MRLFICRVNSDKNSSENNQSSSVQSPVSPISAEINNLIDNGYFNDHWGNGWSKSNILIPEQAAFHREIRNGSFYVDFVNLSGKRNGAVVYQEVEIDNSSLISNNIFFEADIKPTLKPDNLGTLGLIENGFVGLELQFYDKNRNFIKAIGWLTWVEGRYSGTGLIGVSPSIQTGAIGDYCLISVPEGITTHLSFNPYEQYINCFGHDKVTDIAYINPNIAFDSERDAHDMSLEIDNIELYYK